MADDWDAFPVVQAPQAASAPPAAAPTKDDAWSAFPVVSAPSSQPDQPSVASDVARGAGRGAIEGSGSVLGIPGDLWHMLDRGYQWAMTKSGEKMGLLTPEQGEALRAPITTAGGENIEMPADSSEKINNHLLGYAKSLGADTSAPQTPWGQAAETVTSFLPSAAAMGAGSAKEIPKALLKYGVVPGATSEAAGQLTQGTDAEPYARVAGAIAPATLGAMGSQIGRLGNPTAKALDGVTSQQMTRAQQLLDESRAAGAPLTSAEAIQQATGSGTRASDIQRVVEQSPEGAAVMRPFFAQRPGQVENLGRQTMGQVAPPIADPYAVAPSVQQAATGIVGDADQARSAAVKPLYQSAASDTVPLPEMQSFLGKVDGLISADKTGLISPKLVQFRNALIDDTGQPITEIEHLDNARKYFRDEIAQPAIAQDAVPKQIGAKMGSLLSDLNGMMEQASPDFLVGKQRYQDITRNTIEPLQQSPVGQLAAAGGFEKQAQILFNSNPLPGSESAVATAVRDISTRNPAAAEQMVRMYLEKTFNEATQSNASGANQWGGPKFAAVAAGNPQQARNLQAAITALPNGQTRWAALQKSLDIFEAMGRRQPVGSQTEFNSQIAKALQGSGAIGDIAATAASPNKWLGVASDVYKKYAFGKNTKALAQAMVSGNIRDLNRIVGSGANSIKSQAALIAVLAREGSQSGDQQLQ